MCRPSARAWKSNSSIASGVALLPPGRAAPTRAPSVRAATAPRMIRPLGELVGEQVRQVRRASCRPRRIPTSARSHRVAAARRAGAAARACARPPSRPACRPPAAGRVRRRTRSPSPDPGASISTVAVVASAHALRFRDAAQVAVVADDHRHRPPAAIGQRHGCRRCGRRSRRSSRGRFADLSRTP